MHRVPRPFTARIPKGATTGSGCVCRAGGKGIRRRDGDFVSQYFVAPASAVSRERARRVSGFAARAWEAVLGTSIEVRHRAGACALRCQRDATPKKRYDC